MFKKLARSIRQYKKETILTPVCMFGEVVLECIIPLVMAKIVDAMDGGTMKEISYYGLILFGSQKFGLANRNGEILVENRWTSVSQYLGNHFVAFSEKAIDLVDTT